MIIVSGGQTGADRGALDFAIEHKFAYRGWCPKGRKAEDGQIPAHYALCETTSADYLQRTEWNVRDSDASVIFTISAELTGGSKRTAGFAQKHGRPWLHLSRANGDDFCVHQLADFIATHGISILNVAGTRGSKEPEIGAFVHHVVTQGIDP